MIKGEELHNRAEEAPVVAAAEVVDETIPKAPRGAEAVDEVMRKMRGTRQPKAEADELARLTAKIRNAIAAVRIQRAPRGIPDGASWGMGRDAAAAAIEAALGGQ